MLNNVEILLHATRGRWPLLPRFSVHQHLPSRESGKSNEQPPTLDGLCMFNQVCTISHHPFLVSLGMLGDGFFYSFCRHVILTSGALDPIEMR